MQKIIAFTAKINRPSENLMKKLAMEKDHNNFLHPALSLAHPLQEHILCRFKQQQWLKKSVTYCLTSGDTPAYAGEMTLF